MGKPYHTCYVVCGLNSAAYMSEVIRSGIQAVDKGQMEATRSLGMSKTICMRLVIPQAVKIILPAVGNEFVTLIKETSRSELRKNLV